MTNEMTQEQRAALRAADGYVLIKHGLYWRPNSQGYTALLSEAGIYSDDESQGHVVGSFDGMTHRIPVVKADDIAPGASDEAKARYWKARAEEAEARVRELEAVVKATRQAFAVEYSDDGRVLSVGYDSEALRPLIAQLDASLKGARNDQ